MKLVRYGLYDPCTYVDAFMASNYRGLDFSFEETDCGSVLAALTVAER